jgi:hypothetical protein
MNTVRLSSLVAAASGLILFCSCAAARHESRIVAASELPGEIAMNRGAGFGDDLAIMLHLEGGGMFACYVDTGSPDSLLPKSLEQQLGKRIGTGAFRMLGGHREKENIYATPRIYLGDTPLMTGDRIGTWNNTFGILGMDCLRHYCIQLDFQARKIRFLDSEHLNAAELGKAYPMTESPYAYINHNGFFGQKKCELLVDTGYPFDGMVNSKLFKRTVREQKAQPVPLWDHGRIVGKIPDVISFPKCVWDDEIYTDLFIETGRPELIGMKFLARHQVAFNFPKKMMYLKRIMPMHFSAKGPP